MNAVREAHETERNYNQRIKMISLIGQFTYKVTIILLKIIFRTYFQKLFAAKLL